MLFRVLQMIVGNAVHCMVIVGWIFAIIVLVTTSYSEYLGRREFKKSKLILRGD
jgi:hypothetical protein